MDSDEHILLHSQNESDEFDAAESDAEEDEEVFEEFSEQQLENISDIEHNEGISSPAPSNSANPPRKRRLPPDFASAPLKRQKRIFNFKYLQVLNQDIADASAGIVGSGTSMLKASQIGATRWSPVEKEAFFSAVDRLGRDNLPRIATRIGTKSPLEVHQFIVLLSERERTRRDDGDLRRKTLRLKDMPAAAELSQECCNALDNVADDLSLRQEGHEVTAEQKKWGDDQWLVTKELGAEHDEQIVTGGKTNMPFAELFILRNWLRLSERVFLNSNIPDYNWRYFSKEPPSIRATAVSDFHGLVVSITKRLVATALFMSESRIKAKKEVVSRTKLAVKAKDVKAAVDSLRLKPNSRDFWRGAPRRLRLDVYQHQGDATEPSDEPEEDAESTNVNGDVFLSYEEVESTLQTPGTEIQENPVMEATHTSFSSNEDEEMQDVSDNPDADQEYQLQEDDELDPSLDRKAIERDMEEGIHFAADWGGTTRARNSLQTRIVAEHQMEAEAEAQDLQASMHEEARLWGLLGQQGGETALANAEASKSKSPSRARRPVYESAGTNWRESIRYVSEWEVGSGASSSKRR